MSLYRPPSEPNFIRTQDYMLTVGGLSSGKPAFLWPTEHSVVVFMMSELVVGDSIWLRSSVSVKSFVIPLESLEYLWKVILVWQRLSATAVIKLHTTVEVSSV